MARIDRRSLLYLFGLASVTPLPQAEADVGKKVALSPWGENRFAFSNTTNVDGKLILACQPVGFDTFFDEIGNVPADKKSPEMMKELMAKYGMEMLRPPI